MFGIELGLYRLVQLLVLVPRLELLISTFRTYGPGFPPDPPRLTPAARSVRGILGGIKFSTKAPG